ncbi:hypothetical protein [Streptomyces sp. Amel2xC10]|uniref:hypothetical protein n=1 Tax=Streptomyces sp. Amel2xC10 TaxID=1305826 RepID=UPI000A08E5DD|nr:hypothetical protein [Streptomyces sp. Amel2xC10]SMF14875.1 hypothetical protein SAMN02745830_01845 [Streptomyces sp. Amel2xC10]
MRKFFITAAVVGLTALGLGAPATAAQAAETGAQATVCNSKWPGRNGNVYAWDGFDCQGTLLGVTAGNDPDWNSAGGGFANAWDKASSVMNAGYTGGNDIVQFWYIQQYQTGYTCLSPYEYFADDLSDNTFSSGQNVNNNIRAHKWVSSCNVWLT